MRIFSAALFVFIFTAIFGAGAFAQVNIALNDVVKIHLIDGAGYLGGFYRNDYELVREGGQWKTYQTHEQYFRPNFRRHDPSKLFAKMDSAEYRFIKVVSQDSITLFLKTLGTIKSKFVAADLNLSISEITKHIDTAYLKNLDEKRQKVFNSFFNTPAKLYHILDTLQYDSWTDDSPYSVMEIVKKTGDTVKVITTTQTNFMLPWQVNEVPTYDVNINHFFITATNLTNHRMAGKNISQAIYEHVDYVYARDAFERLRWQESAPENLKYIQQHFDILNVGSWNDYSSYTFHPKHLNTHIHVGGIININDKDKLLALTRFAEDTLELFLKKGGFMIDSCLAKKGCVISFDNRLGQASHQYTSMSQKMLDAYLRQFNQQDLWVFETTAGERIEDEWVALPDGRFVLTEYLDDYAVGVLPQYITKDGQQQRKFVFMVFSHDGKLLSKGE